jgi:dihydroflavonol-4-reductase
MIGAEERMLVTGATGALGGHVLNALRAADDRHRLVIAFRGEPLLPAGLSARSQYWRLDLREEVALPEGVQTVLHIAGEKHDERRMWEINHMGTVRLVEAAGRAGVQRFVYVSSVGVYGAPKHAGQVDSTYPRKPRNVYEASKNAGEAAVRELCPLLGMKFVVVQPTNVLVHVADSSYPLLGLMSAIKSDRFAFLGRDEAWLNYVHVDDAAAAIVFALARGRAGATYIVNTPLRLSALAGCIAAELGVPAPSRRIPAWLGAVAGLGGSALQRATGRGMPFSIARHCELTNTTVYDGDGLNRELGFEYPIGIRAAVRALVGTYRREGKL